MAEIEDVMTNPLHARVARCVEDAHGSIARRSNQFIVVFRIYGRDGRRDILRGS
jgi:hypothetical protein